MAVIRDVMPVFELYQPASVDDALALLARHGADAWVLAGGLDSMDWLKDRLRKPRVVVDLTNVAALRGNICYADTPTAVNREHAIFDADRCVAVNPSDTAPALVALDAEMVIRGPQGERMVAAADYWIGPGIDITRMTVLQPGELLTAIR